MGSGSDRNNGSSGGGGGNSNGTKTGSGSGLWASDGHGYCLRWNNHKSNLVEILEALIKMECYVDVTIYVDHHVQFKAHRVVLAACSPFFAEILKDAPSDHCNILFPGLGEFEMRTLLEYIYAGEVNIAESEIPRIMKIARQLEVKGLLDMVDLSSTLSQHPLPLINKHAFFRQEIRPYRQREMKREHTTYLHPARRSPVISTSTKISSAQSSSASPPYNYKPPYASNNYPPQWNANDLLGIGIKEDNGSERRQLPAIPLNLPRAAQNMLSAVYECGLDNPLKRKKLLSMSSMLLTRDTPILRNVLAQSNVADSSQNALPLLANASPPPRGSNNSSHSNNNNDNNENNDSNNNDHGSSNSTTNYSSPSTNPTPGNGNGGYAGFMRKSDRSYHSSNGSDNSEKKYKDEEPQSPYTDKSFDDEPIPDRRPHESPPDYANDLRLSSYLQQHQLQQAQYHQQQQVQQQQAQQSSGGSAGSQKPEWKRYKQYTRADIMAAIECVRNGMSALQASRKYGVPSRTLYDKVKKLGITTGTPRNRSSMKRESGSSGGGGPSSSSAFPYAALGVAPPNFGLYPNQDNQLSQSQDFDHDMVDLKHHRNPHAAALLDPTFLQKALEARDVEMSGRDALHAMALAAAAHAQFNGISSSPHAHGSRSPSELLKIINLRHEVEMMERRNGEHTMIKREPVDESEDEMDCNDKVENLSMQKRESSSPANTPPPHSPQYLPASISITDPSQHTPRGVIMPPIKYPSPRTEPSSTTPPCSDQPLALDKSDLKINLNDPSITLTTTANYDD